ncbi:phage tail protein [Fusobacterium polymorphum]|uniref:phage tail protein n=1 Tax=Fusobacterium nucleatum subsp. polymorphum TaxID=76857 RepID=UPI002B4C1A87|nr:phage tail protein [Fusobacterium polymorphum]WRL75757.1 phage tail protein [Fusobacterium polymorphum]
MAKTIGVLLSLKDQFTTPLQKATKSVKAMDRQLEKAGNKIKAFGNRVKAGMKSVAKWAAIGFGALTAAAGVFIKQSIDAAKDKLKADKLLETNLMKQANFKKEHIQMLKDEASALQDVGVVGDDVAVAGAGQLAIYKLKAEQIKTILPIIDDMVAKEKGFNGTQEDAIAMADVFGKAVEGKTKGLVKYGVSLTDAEEKLFKTMKREQRAEFLNKKLTAAIGGTNKALRETDEGKIVAAKGAWGDMQAELGKKLMPKLGAIAEWFHSKIPAIQDFILSLADKVEELVTRAEPYITQIKDMFGKIFEKVKPALEETWQILSNAGTIAIDIAQNIINNWDRISPIVYTIVGAITAYNIAMTIRNNKELIYAGIIKSKMALDTAQALLTGQLTIKQWALNVAMKANPIGLVITAIALLVGGIWLLCKNWDLVKTKVKEFWARLENNPLGKMFKWFLRLTFPIILLIENFSTIKEKVIGFCKTLKDVFLKVWDAVVGAWNYAKEVISGVCDVLVGIFMPIWEAVSNGFNIAKDIILGVCDVLGGIFLEIWNGAINAWNFMKDTISDLCDTITNVFLKAWDGIMKALDAVLHPIETAKNAFGKLIDKLKFWNKTPADDKTINITENTKKTTETVGGANKTGIATTSIKNPRHALGTAYFKGGVTGINEGGRDETAILPAGTQILSHEEGKSLQKNNTEKQVIIKEVESKKSSDKKVEVHIHIGGNFIGEKEHMEKYGEYTANKILAALNNM